MSWRFCWLVPWSTAQSILDIGCGNGDYLGRISSFFPKKRYLGIDISSAMISIARATHGAGHIDFTASDFFQYAPPAQVDVIPDAACSSAPSGH